MVDLFVDMDGVLADFDRHYWDVFGVRPDKTVDNVNWDAVKAVSNFYLNVPPMFDMPLLWARIAGLRPTVLTGVPANVPEAPANKRAWAVRHLGPEVPVVCCRSSEKYLHAKPGDVLIDDWEKYRDRWTKVGGVWITHLCAATTIAAVDAMRL